MTKAVGDFLGTNGIADEMIRFNGFPFLEKEDHVYNVTGKEWNLPYFEMRSNFSPLLPLVSAVMTKELTTLPESGMRAKDIGVSAFRLSVFL